jgi:transposase InsO family protein
VRHVQKQLAVSERRACRAVEQASSSQRYRPRERSGERELVGMMLQLVRRHPRFGYRRVWALLRAEGFDVNRKRVHRLWKREGLKVPQKQHKRRRLGSSDNGTVRRRALHQDHVWGVGLHPRPDRGRAGAEVAEHGG